MTQPDPLHPVLPAQAKDLPYRSRVSDKTLLAPAIWRLRLETPVPAHAAITPWHFTAGQYTTLGLAQYPDLPLRPYSIASAPQSGHIDLHIRDTGHGVSHAVAAMLGIGDDVMLGHAAGSAVPAAAGDKPLLLLAGGVGIAPMTSIVASRHGATPCHLYWAVEDASQLYLHGYWQEQQARGVLAAYHALTRHPLAAPPPGTPATGLRHGLIGPAVVHDLPELGGFSIYLAGPAAMAAATVPLLLAHGAQKDCIFGDGLTL